MIRRTKGFTLIALLLYLVIVSLLIIIFFLLINPSLRQRQSNNLKRRNDVSKIMEAVKKYSLDNQGSLPFGIDDDYGSAQLIGTSDGSCNALCDATGTAKACLDLNEVLASKDYLDDVPYDPVSGRAEKTLYYLEKNSDGSIIVGACGPEMELRGLPVISIGNSF